MMPDNVGRDIIVPALRHSDITITAVIIDLEIFHKLPLLDSKHHR